MLVDYKELGYTTRKEWYYECYLKTSHFKKLRKRTLKVCFDRCIVCHTEDNLACHHNNYEHLYEEVPIRDTVMLCDGCHSLFHASGNHKAIKEDPIDVCSSNESVDVDWKGIKKRKKSSANGNRVEVDLASVF